MRYFSTEDEIVIGDPDNPTAVISVGGLSGNLRVEVTAPDHVSIRTREELDREARNGEEMHTAGRQQDRSLAAAGVTKTS